MEVFSGATAVAAVALAVTAFVRYLIVRAALKDTKPQDRAMILRSLATVFRAEWHLGPIQRHRQDEPLADQRRAGGSDETAPTDST